MIKVKENYHWISLESDFFWLPYLSKSSCLWKRQVPYKFWQSKNIRIPNARPSPILINRFISFPTQSKTTSNKNTFFMDSVHVMWITHTLSILHFFVVAVVFFSIFPILTVPSQKPINSDCLCRKLLLSVIMLTASSIHQATRKSWKIAEWAAHFAYSKNRNRFRNLKWKQLNSPKNQIVNSRAFKVGIPQRQGRKKKVKKRRR